MTDDKRTAFDLADLANLKISQIQAYLASNDVDPLHLQTLRQDSRKGVQNAILRYDKALLKQKAILGQIEKLKTRENELRQAGYTLIAGVDEVGRGPLAGPVVTSAVILPADMPAVYFNDSKQLSHAKRQALVADIEKYAIAKSIGIQTAEEIDQSNILGATKKAMMSALDQLHPAPDYVLIDAVHLNDYSKAPQEAIIKGDATVYAIAAASIYAKEYRDQLMAKYADLYPGYGFEANAGYGTKQHLEGLEKYGPSPIHRKTFAPVKNYL
ncbi:ribonuclease HII [Aerococcaceae bacterium 50-4]